jgi:hypothetical protein
LAPPHPPPGRVVVRSLAHPQGSTLAVALPPSGRQVLHMVFALHSSLTVCSCSLALPRAGRDAIFFPCASVRTRCTGRRWIARPAPRGHPGLWHVLVQGNRCLQVQCTLPSPSARAASPTNG